MKIHTLANGATVISTSNHEFKFSDGTVAEPQDEEIVDKLTLKKQYKQIKVIQGMNVNYTSFNLGDEVKKFLFELCLKADIVIISVMFRDTLEKFGCRHNFPNALVYNATPTTQRLPQKDKIVDINNWSY